MGFCCLPSLPSSRNWQLPLPPFLSYKCVGLHHSGSGDSDASEPLLAKNNSKHANDPLNTHTHARTRRALSINCCKELLPKMKDGTAFALQMISKSPCFPLSSSAPETDSHVSTPFECRAGAGRSALKLKPHFSTCQHPCGRFRRQP